MDRFLLISLLFSALGCVSIEGGAVEASWVVFTPDGRRISDCGCTCPAVRKVRFALEPVGGGADPCAGRTSCMFSCNQQSGATRFDIPPGSYSISVVPVGVDGNDITIGEAGSCNAVAGISPVVREVVKGRVTSLDAITVLADCAAECGGPSTGNICRR
jgi:hypothetical protein